MGFAVFVMTDVVGSTALWETHGDDMQRALEQHDQLLGESAATGGGRIFKHTGDGMLAVFDTTDAAVGVALDVIDALASAQWGPTGPLQVRVSVHAGQVDERDGDYFGPPLNKTARINGIGHAGQVLVSDVARQLMQSPRGVDLGEHQLRDLSEPVRLWQLDDGDHPPLRTLVRARHNLPAMPTQFIGREAEVTELRRLVAGHRLVTVTGVGGCGKTRLAVEVGAAYADRFPGGVWFADLSPEQDGTAVGTRVLAALGLVQPLTDDDTGPVDALVEATTGMPTLLIVDNCEHLIDDVADFANAVVAECPSVTMLATSRESLAIDGEHVWRIPNLRDGAVELFIERASATGASSLDLTEQLDTVDRICRALDDIPLAIELAAAQCGSLAIEELANRLDNRFAMLGGGRRRGRGRQRQQTLQAMMDWSHGLLSEDEQVLLSELAVFSGTFTLSGVEAIATSSATAVQPRLQSLVEQSLVVPPDDHARYRLLETVRLYALGRLADRDAIRETRDRHLTWMNNTFGSAAFMALGVSDRDSTEMLSHEEQAIAEIENIIAAMDWADENGQADVLFSLFHGVMPVWASVNRYARTGLDWLNRIPTPSNSDPQARATWMSIAGQIHMNLGDASKAFEYFLDGAAHVDDLRSGDPAWFTSWAGVPLFRSTMYASLGDYQAAHADADLLAELANHPQAHQPLLQSVSYMARSLVYSHEHDPRQLDAAERAMSSIRGTSTWGESSAHSMVADALVGQGRHSDALEHARLCLDASVINESLRAIAVVVGAWACVELGRYNDALEIVDADYGPMLDDQRRNFLHARLVGLGALCDALGERSQAERLLSVALHVTDDPFDQLRRRRIVGILGSESAVDQLPEPPPDDLQPRRVALLLEESTAHARTLLAST